MFRTSLKLFQHGGSSLTDFDAVDGSSFVQHRPTSGEIASVILGVIREINVKNDVYIGRNT